MELKGKAHPIALSLLVNTSSETPSAARASGTEKGLCHGKGSPPFREICVQILGISGCWDGGGCAAGAGVGGWARGAVAQHGWGEAQPGWALPAGRGWCLHSAGFSSPRGTCPAPSASPHPTLLLKQRFQQSRPNKSFSVQKTPVLMLEHIRWNSYSVYRWGRSRSSPNQTYTKCGEFSKHKTKNSFIFSLLLMVMMVLLGLRISNREQICSLESVPGMGRSHQGVLGVHGGAKEQQITMEEHRSHGWACLCSARGNKKNEVEKSHRALQRGLGFTVISGEFRAMRSCKQILSQLIIKHPFHTTKSRHVEHILFYLTHTAKLELLHKSIITYRIYFARIF